MPVFELHFERYVQQKALVNIRAKDLTAAIAIAADLQSDERLDHRFEDDGFETTRPRLYSVSDRGGDQLAAVSLGAPWLNEMLSWTSACLTSQWRNVIEPGWAWTSPFRPQGHDEMFMRARPEVSDEVAREAQAAYLHDLTPVAGGGFETARL